MSVAIHLLHYQALQVGWTRHEKPQPPTVLFQAGNQMNRTSDELNDFSAKQSYLEDKITTLQMKMLMNRNQATSVRARAEATYKRAQKIDNVSLSVLH